MKAAAIKAGIAKRWTRQLGRVLRVMLYSSAQLELMELYDLDSRFDVPLAPLRSRQVPADKRA